MFVNAYYKALAGVAASVNMDALAVSGNTNASYFSASSYAPMMFQVHNGLKTVLSGATVGTGIVVGSGTTAPTVDDYKLENRITTVTGAASFTTSRDDAGTTLESLVTITNTADTDITIGEIGIYVKTSGNWMWMTERTVLDTPVTIPAGGIGQVTYTIRMNYPTA